MTRLHRHCLLSVAVVTGALGAPATAFAQGGSPAPSTQLPPPLPPPAEGTPSQPPAADPPPATATPAPTDANGAQASGTDKPRDEKDDDHSVYVSISPLHLLAPMVEGMAEAKLHRKIGVAGIFGVGSIKAGGYKFSVWEAGGQFVGYPVGHFDNGMQLGVEALYAHVSTSDQLDSNTTLSGVGSGLSVGPLIGYKFASKIGFSLNVQGGVAYMIARADVSSGSNTSSSTKSASAEQSAVIPILNLNLGWSF